MIADIEPIVKIISELVGVVSIVVGVVMSIKSFNATRDKETKARHAEALKPFLDREVESSMKALAAKIDAEIVPLKSPQKEVYDLAHMLRDSFIESWGLSKDEAHL